MWYKNDEKRSNPATHIWDEVIKDIVVKKGQFSVQGPGFIAKYQRKDELPRGKQRGILKQC